MENLIIIDQLWTPLHYSVANGHYEISKLIIDEIEIKNPKTRSGWTPLHCASKVELCQLILERVTGDLFLLCQKIEKKFKVQFEVNFVKRPCSKVPNM